MSSNKKLVTDKNICPYLNEIAERLWSTPSHAAIMVGSGFSKNASNDFPDWPTLGDLFFEKIHGRKPDNNEVRYFNVLKLADEVQAAFSRTVLNQLLRDKIPDSDNEPSPLHIRLLEFPWTDVFTTNYDTLIERARKFVSSHKFDIVINKEDLVYSERPRIIKLHGSFPSERPFIITEEDYRTYPKEFAPFVNTVQQSLLENTLCLIGFSGDDPNFLQWIGWIRDNLGKANAPKIYLIGIFSLSDAQKKLLEQRNIVLVDFSICPEIEGSHYKALAYFFDYLESRKKKDNKLDWDVMNEKFHPDSKADKSEQIKHLIEGWRRIRLNYPGWVITPEDIRKDIWTFTQCWVNYVSVKDDLEGHLTLYFAFEINWRLERCLCPIPNNLAELFESILNKYWPFKEKYTETSPICFTDEKYKNLNWIEIQEMWIELSLGMLRFYREEGIPAKWKEIKEKLNFLKHYLSPEKKAFIHYERTLHAFFELDIPRVKSELNFWPTNFSIPFWEAKRGGILAEIGQVEDAEKILDKSLLEVREKLNLKPVTTDYSFVSQEATIMILIRFIKNSINFTFNKTNATPEEEKLMKQAFIESQRDKIKDNESNSIGIMPQVDSDIEDKWNELYTNRTGDRKQEWEDLKHSIRWKKNEKLSKSFQDRWNSLKVYKCDPWNEIRSFENQLAKPPVPKGDVTQNIGFDIGQITETRHMRGWDDEAINAYAFLRYFEESGLPFRIPGSTLEKKSAEGTLQRLADYSPYWTIATLIRIGDAKFTDYIFSRKSLLKYNTNDVDMLIDKYLNALKRVEPEIAESDGQLFVENAGVLLAQIVPEILSRLCCKCSKDKKMLLLDLLCTIYGAKCKNQYRGINNLFSRLIKSLSNYEIQQIMPKLVEIAYPVDTNLITEREFINPLFLIDTKKHNTKLEKIELKPNTLEALFNLASTDDKSKRQWGTASLINLYNLHLLSRKDIVKLKKVLWTQTDNSGFPQNTHYYKFAFINLPHPSNIVPSELIKNYIENTKFPIQTNAKGKKVPITNGHIPLCNEIIGASLHIIWEQKELVTLFYRLVEWWDSDKELLKKKDDKPDFFCSIPEEFKSRFKNLTEILSEVILPKLIFKSTSKHLREEIKRLLSELGEYGLTTTKLKVIARSYLNLSDKELFIIVENSLCSNERQEVIDGLNAFLWLLKNASSFNRDVLNNIKDILGQSIRWRHQVGLVSSLNLTKSIIKDYSQWFDYSLESAALIALDNLLGETKLSQYINNDEFAERLKIQEAAAGLAYQLYKYYLNKNTTIPDVLLKWKKICSSEDEFSEIRTQWVFDIDGEVIK